MIYPNLVNINKAFAGFIRKCLIRVLIYWSRFEAFRIVLAESSTSVQYLLLAAASCRGSRVTSVAMELVVELMELPLELELAVELAVRFRWKVRLMKRLVADLVEGSGVFPRIWHQCQH